MNSRENVKSLRKLATHAVFLVFHVLQEGVLAIAHGTATGIDVGAPMTGVERNSGKGLLLGVVGQLMTLKAYRVEVTHRRQELVV